MLESKFQDGDQNNSQKLRLTGIFQYKCPYNKWLQPVSLDKNTAYVKYYSAI